MKILFTKKKITLIIAVILIFYQIVTNRDFSSVNKFFYSSITTTQKAKKVPQFVKVVRVIDGDTIEIENKKTVRYIGIDTPELHDPRRPVECFAKESYEKNKKLVEGKTVRLEKDVSETDKYKRLLRYVFIDDLFVNDFLIRNGFANISTYPPDVKYADKFQEAEKEARENIRGLWKSCPP